jgi:tricorn protease
MRGLDWKAIGDRYAQYLPYVNHRSDLDFVLGLMIGELGTGHSYVAGLGSGVPPVPVGQLGADYRVNAGKIQIAKIYNGNNYEEARRGPLGDPGVNVKEGDYLLEIDGQPLDASTNPHALLIGKANRTVILTVNDRPTTDGARKVRVRPVANEGQLRYAEFMEDTRKKVDQLSGGRIAYIHVPNTSIEGMIEFNRGFYAQSNKDAVLVDERWNGGGMLPTFFIEALQSTPVLYVQSRTSDFDQPDRIAIPGPKAMLINQYAGSGGDMFPYLFKRAGLGPLIGSRTWGGLVGIRGYNTFVDGGGVTAPEFSIYDPVTNEIVAENRGIDPDIAVDDRPDMVALGRDVQLEKAVEYLMGELKKRPVPQPRKELPRVGKEGIAK